MGQWAGHFSRIGLILGMVALAVALATASASAAKPDRLYPVAESYTPGATATMVGYVDHATHGERRALYIESLSLKSPHYPEGVTRIGVGTHEVSQTANRLEDAFRVSAEFVIPEGLEPGVYMVSYDVSEGLVGGLGASKLWIGEERKKPIRRAWTLDEPEILNLAPDALIKVPGGIATATEIRTGTYFTQRAVRVSKPLGTRDLKLEQTPADVPIYSVGLEIAPTELRNEALFQTTGGVAWWLVAALCVLGLPLLAGATLLIRRRQLDHTM